MRTKSILFIFMMTVLFSTSCEKNNPLAPHAINTTPGQNQTTTAMSQAEEFTPNLEQRKATDENLKLLALGFADLVKDDEFIELLYTTLPCEGWIGLDDFGDILRVSSGRELTDELNAAINNYLSLDGGEDLVTMAREGLIIDDILYSADITIPYFEQVDLSKAPIAAAGVDDAEDRLTAYLISGRDEALVLPEDEDELLTLSTDETADQFHPALFLDGTTENPDVLGQPVTAQEAMRRPLIVIAPGDGPDPNYINDPCYYTNGGGNGNGNGGNNGGGGNPVGCNVGADEDCAYKTGPVDGPVCGAACDPINTAINQCLTSIVFVDGSLNAKHNSGANKVKVRYMISRMDHDENVYPTHLKVGSGNSLKNYRIDLEDRDDSDISNTQSYNNLEMLSEDMICLDPGNGFVYNTLGISGNDVYWYYSRYWITIYEDDWWITNKKEIYPAGMVINDKDYAHRIRATASTDLFYNGMLIIDYYGCNGSNCDHDYLDDIYPGIFKFEVRS